MTRAIMAVLLCGGVLLATWAYAQEPQPPTDKDEPPLRLKKKPRPDEDKPEPAKEPKKPAAEDKKPDEPAKEPEAAEPEQNDKEVLDRVAKNMRSLEERLANKELGDGTRQVGDDILKDLESLIRSMENPPSGGSGGDAQSDPSGSSKDQQGQSGKNGQSGKSGQRGPSGGKRGDSKNQGGLGGGSQQQPGGRKNSGGAGQQPGGGQSKPDNQPGPKPVGDGQTDKNNDPTGTSNKNRTGGGNDMNGDLNNNADLYKDIWGHLPEALRAEMNAYSTDKEMIPKYDALIKKCSRTIAEQSSRKDK